MPAYDACDVTLSVYPHRTGLKNMPGQKIFKYMPGIEKYAWLKNIFPLSQKRPSAFGLGPLLRPRENIFSVRTSQPVNNIYIYIF
jgi:hypothetical protein